MIQYVCMYAFTGTLVIIFPENRTFCMKILLTHPDNKHGWLNLDNENNPRNCSHNLLTTTTKNQIDNPQARKQAERCTKTQHKSNLWSAKHSPDQTRWNLSQLPGKPGAWTEKKRKWQHKTPKRNRLWPPSSFYKDDSSSSMAQFSPDAVAAACPREIGATPFRFQEIPARIARSRESFTREGGGGGRGIYKNLLPCSSLEGFGESEERACKAKWKRPPPDQTT